MHCTGSASLRLHFDETYLLSEDILHPLCSKAVDVLCHRRGRRDRIDRRHIREGIGDIAGSCVAVHRLHFLGHVTAPLSMEMRPHSKIMLKYNHMSKEFVPSHIFDKKNQKEYLWRNTDSILSVYYTTEHGGCKQDRPSQCCKRLCFLIVFFDKNILLSYKK